MTLKILVSFIALICQCNFVFAEIQTYNDKFSKKAIISSEVKKINYFDEVQGIGMKFDTVTFTKRTDTNKYTISFVLTESRKVLFSKAEVKIDNSIHSLKLINKSSREVGVNRIENRGYYEIPSSVAGKIKRARSVALKIIFSNKYDIVWDVPPGILSEWKTAMSKK